MWHILFQINFLPMHISPLILSVFFIYCFYIFNNLFILSEHDTFTTIDFDNYLCHLWHICLVFIFFLWFFPHCPQSYPHHFSFSSTSYTPDTCVILIIIFQKNFSFLHFRLHKLKIMENPKKRWHIFSISVILRIYHLYALLL